jgi:hypothetical protein
MLMARLTCAAMIYQHATRDRDQAIAKALGTFVRDARGTKEDSTEGPERGEQGEALGCNAEFVALGLLQHRPVLAGDFVFAGDRGAETDEFVDVPGC